MTCAISSKHKERVHQALDEALAKPPVGQFTEPNTSWACLIIIDAEVPTVTRDDMVSGDGEVVLLENEKPLGTKFVDVIGPASRVNPDIIPFDKAALNNPNTTRPGRLHAKHELEAMGRGYEAHVSFSTRLRHWLGMGGRRKNRRYNKRNYDRERGGYDERRY